MVTVVIPAHNEGQVIDRLLARLCAPGPHPGLAVVVVANGCTDNTVEVARSFGRGVRVVRIPEASKRLALVAGDNAATDFPRVYVDADVELGAADILALAAELRKPGVLAAGPERILELDGCPWTVRWYYDIWSRLPEVRQGLFGRGVVALSEVAHQRVAALPPLLADDLAASLSFGPQERSIAAGARVTCYPPRTLADLVRRRIRVLTGVAQIERTEHAPPSSARTRPADLLEIARTSPAAAPRLALFAAITVTARLAARRAVARADYSRWLRDDSSRTWRAGTGPEPTQAGRP